MDKHLKVSEAQHIILAAVPAMGVESVRMEQSIGRVLAQEIRANRDLPPYDVSAMDGFAIRSADVTNAPATLEIIEDIKAGDMPRKTVAAGQCARIMTGAPVPPGADAVIRVEDTQIVSDKSPHLNPLPQAGEEANVKSNSLSDWVQINKSVKPKNDVRPQGENMRDGDVVLKPGTEITPGVIGVLATVKAAQFAVYRRPRVAILSTGNELEGMDEPVDPNKIPNSNSYALMAQVQALGIEPVLLGIARDDPTELEQYLKRGLEYDVLLVSGGTSVGVHDYVRPTIEKLGVQMKFWRVAIRPGHPLAFGMLPSTKVPQGDAVQDAGREPTQAYLEDGQGGEQRATPQCAACGTLVFGLPGNPVSSMVCFEEFVIPALRRMMGNPRLYRRTVTARLAHDVKFRPGRTEFIRVQLARDEAGYIASSTGTQSSGVLLSMARADGLMIIPADSTGLAVGEHVMVQLLDGTEFQDDMGFRE